MEDHRSSRGVLLDLQPYNKTIGTKGTTIVSSNSLDKRYESLNKTIFNFDRQRQLTLQGFQEIKQLFGDQINYEHGSSSKNKWNYKTDISQDIKTILSNTRIFIQRGNRT
jgi:hypothetical protein